MDGGRPDSRLLPCSVQAAFFLFLSPGRGELRPVPGRSPRRFLRLCRRGDRPLEGLTAGELADIAAYANRAAALTCSRPGAIPALPTAEELS